MRSTQDAGRTFTAADLVEETGVTLAEIKWLTMIGVLHPSSPDHFGPDDVSRVKMIAAMLDAGFTTEQVSGAVAEGKLNLDHVDNYVVVDPSPPDRTVETFEANLGDGPRLWSLSPRRCRCSSRPLVEP